MALDIIPKQEDGKLKAVASGALPNGKPVIVNSDGTVSVIEETSVSEAQGSTTVFESGETTNVAVVFDSAANKVVVAYVDESNSVRGTAAVGTVSGTSISFGAPVVFESGVTAFVTATYDADAQKVVIAYQDDGDSNKGKAIVGTVSGTSISFGTAAAFQSTGRSRDYSAVYDANAQKVVIAYKHDGNLDYGTAVVGTVSGTSISFGSNVVFESAAVSDPSVAYDSNAQKVVIAYRDAGNSNYGTAIVGTVSGTSISFGTPVVFESATASTFSTSYNSAAQKIVIAYQDGGNSNYGTAIVGTVSGTSISFGTPVVFESASTSFISSAYHAEGQKTVIAYRDAGNGNDGTLIVGTVSGTSISFNTPLVYETGAVDYNSVVYDSNANKMVISYVEALSLKDGKSFVYQPAYTSTTLTAENYIGISSGGSVADTGNATVDIVGTVNKEQSGLTAGQQYYVQTDGTLDTTADDPSVLAGTAVSDTKLVVKT